VVLAGGSDRRARQVRGGADRGHCAVALTSGVVCDRCRVKSMQHFAGCAPRFVALLVVCVPDSFASPALVPAVQMVWSLFSGVVPVQC